MLETYRAEIDAIDAQLLHLLEARLEKIELVGQYKKANAIAVKDLGREAALLEKLSLKVEKQANWVQLKPVFDRIIEISRSEQAALINQEAYETPTVAYFGQPGSYTHEAMKLYFKGKTEGQTSTSFEAVTDAVLTGTCQYGILPIENSSTGSIHAVYDLLGRLPLQIVGEIRCPIAHYLLAASGTTREGIQKVYSHHQALSQCQTFLSVAGYLAEAVSSTSFGAEMASKNQGAAAIGNLEAARYYGLNVLAGPLNDYGANQTRFIIVVADDGTDRHITPKCYNDQSNSIGITFQISNCCGKLCQVLKIFEACHLNLLKIESRPIGERPFEYQFYMDFEGALEEQAVQEALRELKMQTSWMKILGTWGR